MYGLYYGDNFEVSRKYITDKLIESIYRGSIFDSRANRIAVN